MTPNKSNNADPTPEGDNRPDHQGGGSLQGTESIASKRARNPCFSNPVVLRTEPKVSEPRPSSWIPIQAEEQKATDETEKTFKLPAKTEKRRSARNTTTLTEQDQSSITRSKSRAGSCEPLASFFR